jgi:DNA-binding NarL/FixJ family response regulator
MTVVVFLPSFVREVLFAYIVGPFTNREREVLELLVESKSVKEIANALNISVNTVEAHKCNLMRKLDMHTTVAVVRYAIKNKIVRLPESSPVLGLSAGLAKGHRLV